MLYRHTLTKMQYLMFIEFGSPIRIFRYFIDNYLPPYDDTMDTDKTFNYLAQFNPFQYTTNPQQMTYNISRHRENLHKRKCNFIIELV